MWLDVGLSFEADGEDFAIVGDPTIVAFESCLFSEVDPIIVSCAAGREDAE